MPGALATLGCCLVRYHPDHQVSAKNGSISFHPLYIWLSKPFYLLGLDPLLSLMLTSSIAGLSLFWMFYKLASIDLSPERGLNY